MMTPKLCWLATAAIGCAIAAVTLSPDVTAPPVLGWELGDKAQHALAFGALVLPNALGNRSALPATVLCAAAFGGLIELIQPYTGRDASWGDFAADLAGIALAVVMGSLIGNRRTARRSVPPFDGPP